MAFKLTENLPAISELLKTCKEQKKAVRRTQAKLKREAERYSFLGEMLSETGNALPLTLIRFFKSAGYKKVHCVDSIRLKERKNKAEDIHIHHNSDLIICEVTSSKDNGNPPNAKCSVVSNYVANAKTVFAGKNIHGLLIINSWSEQLILVKRNKMPFNTEQIETAKNMGHGLTTTKQLINGYIRLKRGEITFDDFHNKLLKSGEIIF